MASISQQEVEHMAHLAKLELSEAEKATFAVQLNQILTYMDQLQGVSTEGIPLMASPATDQAVLREDISQPGFTQEQALSNAPESSEGFFVVPPILGK